MSDLSGRTGRIAREGVISQQSKQIAKTQNKTVARVFGTFCRYKSTKKELFLLRFLDKLEMTRGIYALSASSTMCLRASFGCAPIVDLTGSPFLKTMSVGILITPY